MIIKIASLIAAIITIISFLSAIYRLVRKVDKKVESFEVNLNKNRIEILRLIIINENMPLDERVNAGEEYTKMGGNGSVHALYEILLEKYKNQLEKKEGIKNERKL